MQYIKTKSSSFSIAWLLSLGVIYQAIMKARSLSSSLSPLAWNPFIDAEGFLKIFMRYWTLLKFSATTMFPCWPEHLHTGMISFFTFWLENIEYILQRIDLWKGLWSFQDKFCLSFLKMFVAFSVATVSSHRCFFLPLTKRTSEPWVY